MNKSRSSRARRVSRYFFQEDADKNNTFSKLQISLMPSLLVSLHDFGEPAVFI